MYVHHRENSVVVFFCFYRFGIYPLTAYALEAGPVRLTTYQPQSPTGSMDQSIPSDRSSVGPIDVEVRRIVNMMCNIKPRDDAQNDFMVSLSFNARFHHDAIQQTVFILIKLK